MRVVITKLTDGALAQKACEFTINKKSSISLDKLYSCEHSPIRTQMFWVEMYDIPTFVSVHLVRHAIGISHFVKSNREDRGGLTGTDRNTPVNHAMLLNAQSLINLARKRLCLKASSETVAVMKEIKEKIKEVDPALYPYLVPECEYRKACHELKSCGYYTTTK